MGDWFTVEQIDADTFAISEYGPWEQTHAYLLSGSHSALLDAFYPTTDPLAFFLSVEKVASLPLRRVLPGHFRLDIQASLVSEVCRGFAQLHANGKLKQSAGIFPFSNFQIHV